MSPAIINRIHLHAEKDADEHILRKTEDLNSMYNNYLKIILEDQEKL